MTITHQIYLLDTIIALNRGSAVQPRTSSISSLACDKHASSLQWAADVAWVLVQAYAEYHPYQFLAYWFEMRRSYEEAYGPLASIDPSFYPLFTGVHS